MRIVIAAGMIMPAAEALQDAEDDSGDGTACTSASPCSLTQALANAQDGDTVLMAAGTYAESSPGGNPTPFTITAKITLEGETGTQPTISAAGEAVAVEATAGALFSPKNR